MPSYAWTNLRPNTGPSAGGLKGPQDFLVPLAIKSDKCVGVLQNGGSRAVICFEPDDDGYAAVFVGKAFEIF